MSKFFDDIAAEGKRLATQGQMELANALFNGSAFVPYGPGQYTPSQDQAKDVSEQTQAEPQQEMDGREM